MQAKVEERKNDLRNTTVLEVILAVIIILLCVVYIKDTEKKTMEKNYIERISELQSENSILREDNKKLLKENKKLKVEIERLERKIKRYRPRSPGEASALEKAEKEIKDLENRLQQLNSKLNPKNSRGKGGVDKPSCLIENGKIEYFAEIIKKQQSFQFLPIGTKNNRNQVSGIPGAKELFAKDAVTLEELQKFGKRVFTHGQNSSPSCVYFVRLDPNKWSGGELKILERYFYKSYR